MTASPRRSLWLAGGVGALISALFLFVTFHLTSVASFKDGLRDVSWWALVLCVPVQILSFVLAGVRTSVLYSAVAPLRPSASGRAFLASFVANNLLPLRIGDLVRTGLLARATDTPFPTALTVVGVERLLDMAFLGGALMAVVPLSAGQVTGGAAIYATVGGILVALAVLAILARSPEFAGRLMARATRVLPDRLAQFVQKLFAQVLSAGRILHSPRIMALTLLQTAVYWATQVVCIALWSVAFHLSLPPLAWVTVTLFLSLGHLIPSAPSGIGTFHFFGATALGLFGVPAATATVVVTFGHLFAIVPLTILGAPLVTSDILAVWRQRRKDSLEPAKQ